MASKRSRTAVKTLTWRVLATTDTFLISYIITGRFDFAGAIAGIEVATKMILYYLHERAWSKIKWGKLYIDLPTSPYPFEDWKIKRLRQYLDKKGNKRLARLLK
tara:strand:+ start:179 stop:490 length:312 start_codon:yes stop_codon:yes gene_type:complete